MNRKILIKLGMVLGIVVLIGIPALVAKYQSEKLVGSGFYSLSGIDLTAVTTNITPATAGTLSVGTTALPFSTGTFKNLITDNLTVNVSFTSGTLASHLIPSADNTYDIGATSTAWRRLFVSSTINLPKSGTGESGIVMGGTFVLKQIGTGGLFSGSAMSSLSGANNTTYGINAGQTISSGASNLLLGTSAGANFSTGNFNVGVGISALQGLASSGANNTAIGMSSCNGLGTNTAFSGNVCVGYQAGGREIESNKLHIANTVSNTLIYGDFATGYINVSSTLNVGNYTGVSSSLSATSFKINASSTGLDGTFNVNGAGDINTSGTLKVVGNVGIGGANPTAGFPLVVGGNIRSQGGQLIATQSSPVNSVIISNSTNGQGRIYLNDTQPLALGTNSDFNQLRLLVGGITSVSNTLRIENNAASSTLTQNTLKIGATSTVQQGIFAVDSSGNMTASGTITSQGTAGSNANDYVCVDQTGLLSSKATACTGSSARDLKSNIQDLTVSTDKILSLQPREYIRKSNGKKEFGLIAEEVLPLIPEMVTYDENGKLYGVEYSQLPIELLKVVKEQQKQIDELKAMVGMVDKRVGLLEKFLNWFKSLLK